ncbi:MAG: MATE family efflux transporter [Gemmatimonadota bacterium]
MLARSGVRAGDREILALALPALGALAADPLVSMVDTAFVGRLGVVPLAALGVNTSVFSLAFVAFNFLAYGTTPLVARAVGRGDREAAGAIVQQALLLGALIGLLATLVLELGAEPIVSVMGAGGDLRRDAIAYLRIRALGGPAVLLILAGHGAYRGYQDTKTPLLVTLGLNAVNLVLDPLLIFGLGWGLEGAAVASLAAQWAGAAGFLHLLLVRHRRALGIRLARPRVRRLLPFLRIGGELAVRTFSLLGTLALATAVATRVGTAAVAAHQVASQVWLFLALVVDSLAVAAQAIVARHRGAGDVRAARAAANRLLLFGGAVGCGIALVLLALAPLVPRLFTAEPGVLRAVAGVLPFVILLQPINGLVFVWDGVFLGAESFRFLAAQMAVSAAGAAVVLLLVLPLGWGLAGVWWGMTALMAIRCATLAARYVGPGTLRAA